MRAGILNLRRNPEERSPSALRNRNFALLWSGQTISVAGNGIFTVALPLEVLRVSDSPLDLSLVVIARTIPLVLLLLVGGTFVDRLSRRLVMFVSDTVSGISVAILAVLIELNSAKLWEFVLLSMIFGTAMAFFMPASSAIPPDILSTDLLVSASSLTSLSQSLGQYLAGPLLGGVIVAVLGSAWAFTIDGISFIISAGCLAAMQNIPAAQGQKSALMTAVRGGLRYSRSQPWLWWSMIAVGIANLVSFVPLVTVLQPLLVRNVFNAGSVMLGIVYAANGTGGALAATYVKRWGAPHRRVASILTSWAGAGLSALFVGISPWPWLAAFFVGAMWFGVTYGNVLWFPLMQEKVPPDLLGRVSSIDWLLSLALSPVGTIVGGVVAGVIGVRLTIMVGGAIAASTIGVIAIPGVQLPDQRPRVKSHEGS